jgi:hypothetical protein
MGIELWGTFSVRDHLVPRAFVADVLLYDRLVIPVPADEPGSEAATWSAKWNAARQARVLETLEELAIPLPWTKQRQEAWQARFDAEAAPERRQVVAEMAQGVSGDVAIARDPANRDLPYRITRALLTDQFNNDKDDDLLRRIKATEKLKPGSKLEVIAAFPSYEAYSKVLGSEGATTGAMPGGMLPPTRIFGWTFFVPESNAWGETADLRLLAEAVNFVRTTDFIEKRSEFYKWLADISDGGVPPDAARADMEKRISQYTELMRRQGWGKVARRAVKVVDAFAGGLGAVNEIAGAAAEMFLGNADIIADEMLGPQAVPPRLKVAAMFHDARGRFGWKPPAT